MATGTTTVTYSDYDTLDRMLKEVESTSASTNSTMQSNRAAFNDLDESYRRIEDNQAHIDRNIVAAETSIAKARSKINEATVACVNALFALISLSVSTVFRTMSSPEESKSEMVAGKGTVQKGYNKVAEKKHHNYNDKEDKTKERPPVVQTPPNPPQPDQPQPDQPYCYRVPGHGGNDQGHDKPEWICYPPIKEKERESGKDMSRD